MVWSPSVSISFSGRHTTHQANKLSQCGESPVSKSGYVQRSKSCKEKRWTVAPTRTLEDINCFCQAHNWQSNDRRAPYWLFAVNLPARMLKARLQQGSLHSAAAGPPPNCGTPEQKSFKVIENHRISLKLDCSSLPKVIVFQKIRKSCQLNHSTTESQTSWKKYLNSTSESQKKTKKHTYSTQELRKSWNS